MSDLVIYYEVLRDQSSKVSDAADELESVSLTAPELGCSTAVVSAAVDRLTSATTKTASSLRSTARLMRTAASDFSETDEEVARGARSTRPGR